MADSTSESVSDNGNDWFAVEIGIPDASALKAVKKGMASHSIFKSDLVKCNFVHEETDDLRLVDLHTMRKRYARCTSSRCFAEIVDQDNMFCGVKYAISTCQIDGTSEIFQQGLHLAEMEENDARSPCKPKVTTPMKRKIASLLHDDPRRTPKLLQKHLTRCCRALEFGEIERVPMPSLQQIQNVVKRIRLQEGHTNTTDVVLAKIVSLKIADNWDTLHWSPPSSWSSRWSREGQIGGPGPRA
uniref:Uncharacterized protein n=1 Tax=Spongospora subterranea TaxID=70186 RepID=A0A0H5QXW3_9EUKA|eukprot:CRZ06587.1 hypothetical protein [Spongospora subterranea]